MACVLCFPPLKAPVMWKQELLNAWGPQSQLSNVQLNASLLHVCSRCQRLCRAFFVDEFR